MNLFLPFLLIREGVKLGNPNPSKDTSLPTAARLEPMNRHLAERWPFIEPMAKECVSYREIARRLNQQGIRTFRGRSGYASSVRQLIQRFKSVDNSCPETGILG